MPSVVSSVVTFAVKMFTGTVFTSGTTLATIGNALAQVAATTAVDAGLKKLTQQDLDTDPDGRRDLVVRSAVSPKAKIYGTALVGGTLLYMNTAGTKNRDLYVLMTLAGHECSDITDVWLDDYQIIESRINWGSDGKVNAGTFEDYCWFWKKLGASGQTVISEFDSAFTDITSNHKGQGNCLIGARFQYRKASARMYEAGPPANIRALVKGALVYDPRLDSTVAGGSGSHRVATPSTWAWSENPALCVADYLIDSDLGMGFPTAKIDYESLIAEADYCDATVSISGGTENRFTCNGVVYTTTKHRENLSKLLSAMNGRISHTGGKFRIRAGRYITPTITITADWMRGDIAVRTATPKSDRFNTVKATIFDAGAEYKELQTAAVTAASYVSRDNGETLLREIKLPMTNSNQMAQRLLFKQLYQTNQPKVVTMPCKFNALQVEMHEHVYVTIDELGWSAKAFRVTGWEYLDMEGINLVLQEDSSSAYDDPDAGDYTTTAHGGVITFGTPGVPAPSGLTATAKQGGILWQWTNPDPRINWETIELYTSPNSAWGSATKVAEGVGTYFNQVLQAGETRYGWIKTITDVDESIRDPDSDTSTVTATALDKLGGIATGAEVNTLDAGDGLAALDTTQNTKLNGIATGAEVNTIDAGDGLAALDSGQDTKLDGIAALADVSANGRIGVYKDTWTFGSVGGDVGACYLFGYDQAGSPSDINGKIIIDGAVHTLLGSSTEARPVQTALANKNGFIAYDKGDTTPWLSLGIYRNVAFVFQETDGTWKYDFNGVATTFTVTANMFLIGSLTTGSTDTISAVSVWGFGIPMAGGFANIAATFGSNWDSDLLNIPTNVGNLTGSEDIDNGDIVIAPSGLALSWVWDGIQRSPSASTQDVPVVFTDVAGNAVNGTTTVRFTYVDDDHVTAAETGSNAFTVVATHAGGANTDAYVTAKVTHTASGVVAYIYCTILVTGGSGGK